MSPSLKRRAVTLGGASIIIGLMGIPPITRSFAQVPKPLVEVWKSPTCGCCKDWVNYLEAHGFEVRVYDQGNHAKRAELRLPLKYASCHTALVQGYVLEGNVPVREIHRLLREQPRALGLAVPNMPIGSPGMDGPQYGGQKDPFDVLLVERSGQAGVYAQYPEKKARRS